MSACLLFLLVLASGLARAQSRRAGDPQSYLQLSKPDPVEGQKILTEFRQNGWGLGGAYYLEFELRVQPRRGDERVVRGQMWGRRNERGPVTRVALQPGGAAAERRLLVQVGAESAAWSWPDAGGGVATVGVAALFAPLAGTDLAAFDLQMPFLWWADYTFEGVAPVRGRPAHVFLMRPPAAVAALKPELTGVRVYLDTQFNALVQAEEMGKGSAVLKSITVLDLKKVGEQWIVKTIDLRDETTRNKTRFVVTGAALGLDFSSVLFEPARLAEPITPPAADKIEKIAP